MSHHSTPRQSPPNYDGPAPPASPLEEGETRPSTPNASIGTDHALSHGYEPPWAGDPMRLFTLSPSRLADRARFDQNFLGDYFPNIRLSRDPTLEGLPNSATLTYVQAFLTAVDFVQYGEDLNAQGIVRAMDRYVQAYRQARAEDYIRRRADASVSPNITRQLLHDWERFITENPPPFYARERHERNLYAEQSRATRARQDEDHRERVRQGKRRAEELVDMARKAERAKIGNDQYERSLQRRHEAALRNTGYVPFDTRPSRPSYRPEFEEWRNPNEEYDERERQRRRTFGEPTGEFNPGVGAYNPAMGEANASTFLPRFTEFGRGAPPAPQATGSYAPQSGRPRRTTNLFEQGPPRRAHHPYQRAQPERQPPPHMRWGYQEREEPREQRVPSERPASEPPAGPPPGPPSESGSDSSMDTGTRRWPSTGPPS